MYYTDNEVRELLEQAFQEGYDNGINDTLDYIDENYELEDDSFDLEDEYEYYTESKAATKKRNTEIGNEEIEKRFRPVNFKNKFDDHRNQMTHSFMVSKDLDNNPHYIKRKPSGRISLIRSTDYISQDKLQNSPYLDRTNAVMDLNKNQIKGAKDETERKDKIRKAKEMYKRLRKNRE